MLRRLVLDVLKPYSPNIVDLSEKLVGLSDVEYVNIILYEIESNNPVENVKVIIDGSNLNFEMIKKAIEAYDGLIHSVDKVGAGGDNYKPIG